MTNNKLFVGNLAYSVTEEQLKETFAQTSPVRSVRIALDRETQRPRGFAFVEMETEAGSDAVIAAWNTQPLQGRALHIEKAQDRPPRPRTERPEPGNQRAGGSERSAGWGSRAPQPGGNSGSWTPRPPQSGRFFPPPVQKDEGRRQRTKPDRKPAEKRRSGRPEQRERGKWHWDGNEEY